jgi:small subunit ribosomal protein S17
MERNLRKERIGVVSSNKMEKTIVVSETMRVKHPMYGKFVLKRKNILHTTRTTNATKEIQF